MIDKIGNPANAYAALGKTAANAGAAPGGSFMDMLSSGIHNFIDSSKTAETMAGKGVAGKADTMDMVQAINAADMNLQTVVAVRDKLIGAYTELMRMQM